MPGPDPGISGREVASSGMRSSGLRFATPEDEVFPPLAAKPQFIRFHFTERQISPPMTQPAVVSVLPESVIVPE